jgi:protein arginine kinase activator
MSKSLQCQLCDAVATVHLTQIVQGKVHKVHYCEACASKGGATDAAVFQLAEAVTTVATQPTITCFSCRFNDLEFRRTGRLGCPDCWPVFLGALQELLAKVQHRLQHVGRAPVGVVAVGQLRHRLHEAKTEMEIAIAQEDYESAARLRDEIAQLLTQIPES